MVIVEPSAEISDRVDFPLLLNARGTRFAVEIGTDMGTFARQFLDRWQGEYMVLIDPYEPHPEFPYDRTLDMTAAVVALWSHQGRFRFIRARSPAIEPFVRWKVDPDFVYIDAGHEYEATRADIAAWWPRIAPHGMLAGHDYNEAVHPGVVRAVNEFAAREGRVVRLTSEPDFPLSWYVYREEPREMIHQFFRKGTTANPWRQGAST